MRITFNEFAQKQEEMKFAQDFDNLCAQIVESGLPFEEFWKNQAIPVLLETNSTTETQLLTELGLPRWMGGQGMFKPSVNPMTQQMSQNHQAMQQADMQKKQAAREAKLQQYQGTVNQAIQTVKHEFVKSMREFLGAMTTNAKNANDYTGYKVAKAFYEKIMGAAQPIIDKFAMTAKYGKRDDSDFNRERTAMNQNHQAAMKQQLGDKFRQGPQLPPQQQNIAAMGKY